MSCLFDSLSHFITNISSLQFRNIIVDELEKSKNHHLISGININEIINAEFPNMKIEDYIQRMRLNNTWGGALEIKIFCDIMMINVKVHDIRNDQKKAIEFISERYSPYWLELNWNGFHYTPKLI